MDIRIIEKNDRKIIFIVEGIKSSFAGALRRIMVSEIPTMSIEWVDFKLNDSAMTDEVLANRIGQIPLTYDKKAYNFQKDCKCKDKGCSRCQVKLSLNKKGPCMVYSDDLKITDKGVNSVLQKIPIVELFDDQDLKFTAVAQLGLGKDHAKWQGAVVGYKNLSNIKINSIQKDDTSKFVKICPKNVFSVKAGKLTVTDPTKCTLCMNCVEASKNNEIEVKPIEDSFIFNVESASGFKAEEVVLMSAETLGNKMKDFEKALKKLK